VFSAELLPFLAPPALEVILILILGDSDTTTNDITSDFCLQLENHFNCSPVHEFVLHFHLRRAIHGNQHRCFILNIVTKKKSEKKIFNLLTVYLAEPSALFSRPCSEDGGRSWLNIRPSLRSTSIVSIEQATQR